MRYTGAIFLFQDGKKTGEVPLNETYWAPFDAHDPILIQEIILGLTLTPAQKVDLGMARNTKLCKLVQMTSLRCYQRV